MIIIMSQQAKPKANDLTAKLIADVSTPKGYGQCPNSQNLRLMSQHLNSMANVLTVKTYC